MKAILTKLKQLEGKTIKSAKQAFHADGDSYYFIVLETTDDEFAIIECDHFDYDDAGVKILSDLCSVYLNECGLIDAKQFSEIQSREREFLTCEGRASYLKEALDKIGISVL